MKKLEENMRKVKGDEFVDNIMSSVELAQEIADFAHKGVMRLDGISPYIDHPNLMAQTFDSLGLLRSPYFSENIIYKFNIEYKGVLEVCWLHDVIEDTIYTEEDIEDFFKSKNSELYYKMYIKEPLLLVTHDKTEAYPIYIKKCCQNQTSALVKFLDMYDNLNPFTLDTLDEKAVKRFQDYAVYMKIINDKFHFIERFIGYFKCVKMTINNE